MSLEIINRELQGRSFQASISGELFRLPSLDTKELKAELRAIFIEEKEKRKTNKKFYFSDVQKLSRLIKVVNDPRLSAASRSLKLREASKLFSEWWSWSGVDYSKYYGVLEFVDSFGDAFEIDLYGKNIKGYSEFFDLSLRSQCSLLESILSDLSSKSIYTSQKWEFPWSLEAELISKAIDVIAQVASGGQLKGIFVLRPWSKKATEVNEKPVSDEERKLILAKLMAMGPKKEG